jgi:hypothetical protein
VLAKSEAHVGQKVRWISKNKKAVITFIGRLDGHIFVIEPEGGLTEEYALDADLEPL